MTGPRAVAPPPSEPGTPRQVAARVLDLRPYACPLTYVKARIALERLGPGERVEVWLAAGEAVENVPRSAAEEGHQVLAVEPLEAAPGAFRVVVEKGAPAAGGLP